LDVTDITNLLTAIEKVFNLKTTMERVEAQQIAHHADVMAKLEEILNNGLTQEKIDALTEKVLANRAREDAAIAAGVPNPV